MVEENKELKDNLEEVEQDGFTLVKNERKRTQRNVNRGQK